MQMTKPIYSLHVEVLKGAQQSGGPVTYSLTSVPPLPMVRGLLTRVIVLVTPPTTVVTTWAC